VVCSSGSAQPQVKSAKAVAARSKRGFIYSF
jgi:hypothetical protein